MTGYVEKTSQQKVEVIEETKSHVTYWPVNEDEPNARITVERACFEATFRKVKATN